MAAAKGPGREQSSATAVIHPLAVRLAPGQPLFRVRYLICAEGALTHRTSPGLIATALRNNLGASVMSDACHQENGQGRQGELPSHRVDSSCPLCGWLEFQRVATLACCIFSMFIGTHVTEGQSPEALPTCAARCHVSHLQHLRRIIDR